jgi:excisionase family DNA binding protein
MQKQITLLNITEDKFQMLISRAVESAIAKQMNTNGETQSVDKAWLTRMEAARYLKISLPSLDKLTKQGKLIASRIGRKKLYSKDQINKSLNFLTIKNK